MLFILKWMRTLKMIEDGLPLRASLGSTGIGFLTIVGNEVCPSFCARLVEQEKHFKVFNIKK